MSTRSYICIEQENKSYKRVYCHSDGYLEYNGEMLITHYNSRELAEKIIALGNLSVLKERLYPTEGSNHNFDYDLREEGVTVAYGRDRGETGQEAHEVNYRNLDTDNCIDYTYIFTKENVWMYFKEGQLKKGLRDVADDLKLLSKKEEKNID